ncbi:MAG: putative RNA uridine N3 methyltransferase, partial [Candidatus Bathyarchaeia archaeon]
MLPNNPSANEGKKALARYPLKRSNSLTLALPASLVEDVPHLREKTQKIGLIGRTAAIFRVDNIIIYRNQKQLHASDQALIGLLLEYMATPQYLRRTLFKLRPELR